jgi:hypothetical protein
LHKKKKSRKKSDSSESWFVYLTINTLDLIKKYQPYENLPKCKYTSAS